MTFKEALERFKQDENAETVMPITEDPSLRNGILAWQSMPIEYDSELECPSDIEDDEKKLWEWLWDSVKFDYNRFAVVTGCKAYDIQDMLLRLRSLQLIYPDGTINSLAKTYLKGIVAAQLVKMQGKRGGGSKSDGKKGK